MRTIEWTGQFKRDYKRESKGQYSGTLKSDLFPLIDKLANDLALEPRHRDHPLTGEWRDHRDCHIRPDLVLIYQKSGAGISSSGSSWISQRIGIVGETISATY